MENGNLPFFREVKCFADIVIKVVTGFLATTKVVQEIGRVEDDSFS